MADRRNQGRREHGFESPTGELPQAEKKGSVREWIADGPEQFRAAANRDDRMDGNLRDEASQRRRLQQRPDDEECGSVGDREREKERKVRLVGSGAQAPPIGRYVEHVEEQSRGHDPR